MSCHKYELPDARTLFFDDGIEAEVTNAQTFPIQLDPPSRDESLLSYVARVGRENGRYFLNQVLRISFPDQLPAYGLPFSGIDLQSLSVLLGVPLDLLEVRLYTGPSRMPSPRKVAYLNGQAVPRKLLSTARRRIAPNSMASNGYHRSIWDLLPLTCCFESGEKLIDRCSCGKTLTWRNNDFSACGDPACLVDLRELTPEFVEPEQLERIRFLGRLFSPDEQDQRFAISQIPPVFSDLSTAELLELILLFGVAHSDPIGKIARKRRQSLCNGNFSSWTTEDLVAGIEVVLEFPASFERLLDRMIESAPLRPGRGSLGKYIGVLTELTVSKPFSARVVAKFKSFIPDALNCRPDVTLNPKVRTSAPKYLTDTISITDACKKHGLNYNRIAYLASTPGFLKTEGRGHGTPVLLDAKKVDEAVKRFRDLVSVTNAATELGISLSNMQRLVSDGFLKHAAGPEVAMCGRASMRHKPASYVYRSTMQELFGRIEARATVLKEPVRLVNGTVRIRDGVYLGLKGILEGKIAVGIDVRATRHLRRLLMEESEFRSYVYSQTPGLVDEEEISLKMAAKLLKLKWSVARELLKKAGVRSEKDSSKVKRMDVIRIAEKYISGGEAAKLLGTLPRHVLRHVSPLGVGPAITLSTRGAIFYDRAALFRKGESLFTARAASHPNGEKS